jgi:hypothetical protein
MQALVIQKEMLRTRLGLRKPRGWRDSELGKATAPFASDCGRRGNDSVTAG